MGQAIPQPIYVQFVRETCYKCSMPFWMPEHYQKERFEKRDTFYCPAGHGQVYAGERESDRLRKMLNDANARNTGLLSDLTATQNERDKLARKVKRVERGVCPHCNRSFNNLQRHMACKHK